MTLTWRLAHRIASIAAVQAHEELSIDTARAPIDVAAAIGRAGVELMYQPLPALFGAYLADSCVAGILVNSRMSRAVRRQTAAHELGHHRLGHGTVYDAGASDDTSASLPGAAGAPAVERTAEAFAAWFLMPRRAVRTVLSALGYAPPLSAAQVYQIALRLGTSYATTARHLVSLRLATAEQCRGWVAVPPGRIKRQLAGEMLDGTAGVDVWDLTPAPGTIVASPGDVLVVAGDRPEVDGAVALQRLANGLWAVPVPTAEPRFSLTGPGGASTVEIAYPPLGRYRPVTDGDGDGDGTP
jgi:Zn-dependent peptidase ImmA (M78 family)